MTFRVTVPDLRTERLVLRAPQTADFAAFSAFLSSERTQFMGGPVSDPMQAARAFGHLAGLWVLRGYGMFVLERRDTGAAIGHAGAWHPMDWPERELGWSLWSAGGEGQGFMGEAMQRIHAWVFGELGWRDCVSYVDVRNTRSAAVARRLGAEVDPAAAVPGGRDPAEVDVWRHRPGGAA